MWYPQLHRRAPMKVKCDGCGSWHTVSPTAMSVIIYAFQHGDLQQVTRTGVVSLCLGDALTPESVAQQRKDSKTVIAFDEDRWVGKAA